MSGHSGCTVYLCEARGKKFIRKYSANEDYNDRLKSQMNKQIIFRDINSKIKTPVVFDSGIEQDLFYFDMDYIAGNLFSDFISLNQISKIEPIIRKIVDFIDKKNVKFCNYQSDIEVKISMLKTQCTLEYIKYFDYCLDHDWTSVRTAFCHGDLTFENILIYNSDVYFIDFLDSFIESPLIDISKMLQDVLLLWSWRGEEVRPFIKNIYILNLIKNLTCNYNWESIKRLLILNVLRILPYANNTNYSYINDKLKYLERKYGI